MKVRNVTENIIREAIEKTGHIVLNDLRQGNGKGTVWRFTLRPIRGDRHYGKVSPHSGRKIHAVCWHGHRDFFQNLFDLAPNAVVTTGMFVSTVYRGREDFLKKFPETAYTEIGSVVYPAQMTDSCDCEEVL